MQSNITQRLAQKLIHKKQIYTSRENAKSINEELLQMVSHIRSLEDQLLAQQYRQELLVQQNQVYKSKLEKMNSRNDVQRQRIAKLEEEYQVHKIKNNELQMCEDSLKAIYKQINDLTKVIQDRAEQCEILTDQCRRVQEQNKHIHQNNLQLQQKHEQINSILMKFIAKFAQDQRKYNSLRPVLQLKHIMQKLKEQLLHLETENNRMIRQGNTNITLQRQAIIKLQFEYELLKERAKDDEKLLKLNQIYANSSNLESVVQEMLVKEDQLVETLSKLQKQHAKVQKHYQNLLQNVNDENQQGLIKAENQVRGLQIQKQRLKTEIKQANHKIVTRTERYQQIYQQQQMTLKMEINLSSLKRLRQVQQRNKYLKLKINELEETKALLNQEKELLHFKI